MTAGAYAANLLPVILLSEHPMVLPFHIWSRNAHVPNTDLKVVTGSRQLLNTKAKKEESLSAL